jgi:hypothetical protein
LAGYPNRGGVLMQPEYYDAVDFFKAILLGKDPHTIMPRSIWDTEAFHMTKQQTIDLAVKQMQQNDMNKVWEQGYNGNIDGQWVNSPSKSASFIINSSWNTKLSNI